MDAAKEQSRIALSAARRHAAGEVASLRAKHRRELAKLVAQTQSAVSKVSSTYASNADRRLAAATKLHEEQIASLRAQHAQEVTDLQDAIADRERTIQYVANRVVCVSLPVFVPAYMAYMRCGA